MSSLIMLALKTMDEPGGLPASCTHHLCRKAVSTCARREGLRTIHVQKWLPIDKTHAHARLQSWGYRGFVDMPGEKRRDAEPVTAGASAKKKQRKPAPEPVQDDVRPHVPDLDEAAGEEEADKVFHPRDSVAKALETSNVLDELLGGGRPEKAQTGAGQRRAKATAGALWKSDLVSSRVPPPLGRPQL